ncbi:MAG TPA: hypothetical protein VFM74_05335 [Candidatus Limnocylindria bacterium]|nr:hypothetical protein [Candidatus Limnocylindria bacterium]
MTSQPLARALGAAMALYLRLVAATARVSGDVTREQVVLAFWHEYNLAAFCVAVSRRGDLPHVSFSTRGFRGLVITTLLRRSGTRVAVLPLPAETDRAEARDLAMRMARLAAKGWSLIVTPDGPFGPYRAAKPGALMVARASGLPIQPWVIRVRPAIRLTKRWDRHIVPLPFCRIEVIAGQQLRIGRREPLRGRLAELQAKLDGDPG